MSETSDRLKVAQWALERQLAWISTAEVKVGAVIAINTAMLGGLATAFNASHLPSRTAWAYLFTLAAAGVSLIALFCAAMALVPRIAGPKESLLFFARVAAGECHDYQERFAKASDAELLKDFTAQVYRNAEIASDKYKWVGKAIRWSSFNILPWVAAIGLLVKA